MGDTQNVHEINTFLNKKVGNVVEKNLRYKGFEIYQPNESKNPKTTKEGVEGSKKVLNELRNIVILSTLSLYQRVSFICYNTTI